MHFVDEDFDTKRLWKSVEGYIEPHMIWKHSKQYIFMQTADSGSKADWRTLHKENGDGRIPFREGTEGSGQTVSEEKCAAKAQKSTEG